MNYNVAAYIIYLFLTLFVIVVVGKLFHKNGRVFILNLMEGDARHTDYINNVLLVAYYLFNIGYAFLKLAYWQKVVNLGMLITSISNNMSLLIFILAITHYINMLVIFFLSKKHSITHKSFQS